MKLAHKNPAAFVEGDPGWFLDHGFAGNQLDLKTLWQSNPLGALLRGKRLWRVFGREDPGAG